MKGRFIYIVKGDSGHPDHGKYVQPTRRVYPTSEMAQEKADGAAPSRKPIVVELPEPVEVGDDYYPIES
jgi:hypothetical protein